MAGRKEKAREVGFMTIQQLKINISLSQLLASTRQIKDELLNVINDVSVPK
jgi:hypothetical protein